MKKEAAASTLTDAKAFNSARPAGKIGLTLILVLLQKQKARRAIVDTCVVAVDVGLKQGKSVMLSTVYRR